MNPAEMRERLRNYARTQPGTQWFRIVNQAGMPTQVMIYDEIGHFGVSAQEFNNQLDGIDHNGPVELYVNSPGGEIFDGISIYNQLLRFQDVSVFIDGIAASAASFIAQAASPGKLGMAKNSKMMIHNGQAFAAGDAKDLRKMAEILDAETQNIASIYADRTGRPAADFLAMMDTETWLSASQACTEGLADYVYDPRKGPQNVIQVRNTDTGKIVNADKYHQEDRDRMAQSGEAMPDGSYPIADEEDLDNAIHAVGRGGASHDAIRKHVIERAGALKLSSKIPDNWNSDGSLKSGASDSTDLDAIGALLANALKG